MSLTGTSIPARLLEPGERILWFEQPRQGLLWRPCDWFVVPFSAVWFGFSLIWTAIACYAFYSAVKNADHFEIPFLAMFPLVGFVFCLVGYQFAIGRFFRDAQDRKRTLYALSNKRAFLLLQGETGYLAYVPIARDTEIEHLAGPDGFGTLRFLSGTAIYAQSRPNRDPLPSFEFTDAKRLHDAILVIKRIQEHRA